MKTRIALVDGSAVRCAQVASRLRKMHDFEVVASAVSAAQALRQIVGKPLDVLAIAPNAVGGPDIATLQERIQAQGVHILFYPSPPETAPPARSGDFDSNGQAGRADDPAVVAHALAHALAGIQAGSADSGSPPLQALPNSPLVCIGASTGGLPVVQRILESYPEDGPPTVIVQHIRGEFSAGVATRLDRTCQIKVMEAYPGAPLRRGCAYIAPGDETHLELRGRAAPLCHLVSRPKVSGHRPSVDALFHSAARQAAPDLIGVLLTGMGRDGAAGLLEIRNNGGHTIVQDSATSIVYGMPRAAVELGAAQRILPDSAIASAILGLCQPGSVSEPAR